MRSETAMGATVAALAGLLAVSPATAFDLKECKRRCWVAYEAADRYTVADEKRDILTIREAHLATKEGCLALCDYDAKKAAEPRNER